MQGIKTVILVSTIAILCIFSSKISLAKDGVPFDREPYSVPYTNYVSWLEFMDKAPDEAWQAKNISRWIDEDKFKSCVNGKSIKIETFRYLSDGLSIRAFQITPRERQKNQPVVLFAHGGVAKWGRITFFDILEMCRLADRGFIVLASTLRGEGGSEGQPNLGSGEVKDMLNLIAVVNHIDQADPDRIGLWGFSRGGGLSYRLLAATTKIRSAVVVGAPSDMLDPFRRAEFHEHVYPQVVDDYLNDPEAALRSISAQYWPEKLNPATHLLMLHGGKDTRVKVEQTLEMATALAKSGHPNFGVQVFSGGSHTLIEQLDRMRAAMDQWFDSYLK